MYYGKPFDLNLLFLFSISVFLLVAYTNDFI